MPWTLRRTELWRRSAWKCYLLKSSCLWELRENCLTGGNAAAAIRISCALHPAASRRGSLFATHRSGVFMNNALPIDLQAVAKQVMLAHGFDPDFPPRVLQEIADLK